MWSSTSSGCRSSATGLPPPCAHTGRISPSSSPSWPATGTASAAGDRPRRAAPLPDRARRPLRQVAPKPPPLTSNRSRLAEPFKVPTAELGLAAPGRQLCVRVRMHPGALLSVVGVNNLTLPSSGLLLVSPMSWEIRPRRPTPRMGREVMTFDPGQTDGESPNPSRSGSFFDASAFAQEEPRRNRDGRSVG
jgi:hypothetical protein